MLEVVLFKEDISMSIDNQDGILLPPSSRLNSFAVTKEGDLAIVRILSRTSNNVCSPMTKVVQYDLLVITSTINLDISTALVAINAQIYSTMITS